jgi:serine protease Do
MDTPQPPSPEKIQQQNHPANPVFAATIVISLIFGAIGGALGATYLPKIGSPAVNQRVVVAEDSAIIDVVKKVSPAVVSVIISKDLNKVPGFGGAGVNGFGFDPLSPFFNFGSPQPQQQPQSQTPNVQQIGAGSGFFVSADGLILTNKHVVSDEQASYSVLTNDGKHYDATVLARDPLGDIAILKIDIKNAPTVPLGDSSAIQIGQRVVAIGNSLGQYQNTVTSGIVSGIGRSVTAGGEDGSEQLEGVIQTDAAINPGNSGGPLLNIDGQVIGVNTAIDQGGQLVGFALPVKDAQKDLDSFKKTGKIIHPYLGVRYVLVNDSLVQQDKLARDYGALISKGQDSSQPAIVPGSPAEKAGLQENDIILAVNGTKVDENNSLVKLLKDYNVGDTLQLRIYHAGAEKTVSVTLQAAP